MMCPDHAGAFQLTILRSDVAPPAANCPSCRGSPPGESKDFNIHDKGSNGERVLDQASRGAGTRSDGIGVMPARHAAALREDSPRASGSRLAFTTPTPGVGLPAGEINVLER